MKISGTAENYKICNATCHIYKVNVLASIFNEIEGNKRGTYGEMWMSSITKEVQKKLPTSTKTTQKPAENPTQSSQTPKVGISDDDLKNRVSLRVSAPGYKYPWYRWVIPMLGETTAGIGAIGIPVVVALLSTTKSQDTRLMPGCCFGSLSSPSGLSRSTNTWVGRIHEIWRRARPRLAHLY